MSVTFWPICIWPFLSYGGWWDWWQLEYIGCLFWPKHCSKHFLHLLSHFIITIILRRLLSQSCRRGSWATDEQNYKTVRWERQGHLIRRWRERRLEGETQSHSISLWPSWVNSPASRRLKSPGLTRLPPLRQDSIYSFCLSCDPGETSAARLPCCPEIQLDIPGPPPDNCWGRTLLKYDGGRITGLALGFCENTWKQHINISQGLNGAFLRHGDKFWQNRVTPRSIQFTMRESLKKKKKKKKKKNHDFSFLLSLSK